MRPSLLFLTAALAATLLPVPAHAVRPWHSQVILHPKELSDAKPLREVALKKKALSETKHNGPLVSTLPRNDRLKKYVAAPERRGGARSATDPMKSGRRGGATGEKVVYNRTHPYSDKGRLPQAQRLHSVTPPH